MRFQDLAYAARGLRRTPAFSLSTVLLVAFGLGGNAAMVSILDRLLLRPPAGVEHVDAVVRLMAAHDDAGSGAMSALNYPAYRALTEGVPGMTGLAGYYAGHVTSGHGTDAVSLRAQAVTSTFFTVLGTRPALGRLFETRDDDADDTRVVVLGYSYWKRAFAQDTSVVGKTITLHDSPFTVVGIAPPGFSGLELEPVDVWLPLGSGAPAMGKANWRSDVFNFWLSVVGRMRSDVGEAVVASQATLAMLRAPELSQLPEIMRPNRIQTAGVAATRTARRTLEIKVSAAVTLIALALFLAACANIANLSLARVASRSRDIAVRSALGAGHRNFLKGELADALLLTTASTVAAGFFAAFAGALLRRLLLPDVEWGEQRIDAAVLLTIILGGLVVAVLLTLVPVIYRARLNTSDALRFGTASTSSGIARVRATLLVVQTAMSVVLLSGAGLFIRSLANVRGIDTGIDLAKVMLVSFEDRQAPPTLEQARAFYDEVARRTALIPGVAAVSVLEKSIPLQTAVGMRVTIPGRVLPRGDPGAGPYYSGVDESFFRVLGSRIVRGRSISTADRLTNARVMVINETMAARFWPGQNPVGRCVMLGSDSACTEVIGVSENIVKLRLIGDPEPSFLYIPTTHRFLRATPPAALLVRTDADAESLVGAVRKTVAGVDPDAITVARSYSNILAPQVRPWLLGARILTVLGILALVTCAVGIYGLVAYSVSLRSKEFGIRITLGAQLSTLLGSVLKQVLGLVTIGVVLGVGGSLVAGRWLESALFGVRPSDPATLAAVVVLLALAGIAASLVPAYRAGTVDPSIVLRQDAT
jgi:predicted permease